MRHADVGGLRMYCNMAKDADGLPNMQKLGRNRLNDLPPEGVCVCVLTHATSPLHCTLLASELRMYVRTLVTIVWAEYH